MGDEWFKIQEDGYNNGEWGTCKVINNGGLDHMSLRAAQRAWTIITVPPQLCADSSSAQ